MAERNREAHILEAGKEEKGRRERREEKGEKGEG
jgi:hypothetical protein